MSPHPSIRGGFSPPLSQFKGPITMDQSVSTPSGASEYAVLRRNNIRLEKGSSHGTLARHSDWTGTVRKREASFENRYSLFFSLSVSFNRFSKIFLYNLGHVLSFLLRCLTQRGTKNGEGEVGCRKKVHSRGRKGAGRERRGLYVTFQKTISFITYGGEVRRQVVGVGALLVQQVLAALQWVCLLSVIGCHL